MPIEFQRQAEKRIAEYEPRLAAPREDGGREAQPLVEKIYRECVYGSSSSHASRAALPVVRPGRRVLHGAVDLGQCCLIAFAPLDDDAVVREAFDNYRYTIERPPGPRGQLRYGMVPNFMGPRSLRNDGKASPPLGYSESRSWLGRPASTARRRPALIEQALPWLVAFDEWDRRSATSRDGLIEYGAYEAVADNTLLQPRASRRSTSTSPTT